MRPAALEHNLEETHQNFEGAAHFCKGALRAGEPEAAASVVDDEQTRCVPIHVGTICRIRTPDGRSSSYQLD